MTVAGVSGVLEKVMSEDLEAILSGNDGADEPAEQPQEPVAEVAAEPVVEAVEATGEETAEPAADESPSSEESKVEDSPAESGLKAELARIRAKNRELEDRMNQPPPQVEEKRDFFEDPDAALAAMDQRNEQKIAKLRIDMSETMVRDKYEDFDDKISVFTEEANKNPALWQEMGQAQNPALFAYKQANQVMKMREFGDIGSFEEKVRADERTKAEAKIRAEYETKMKELSDLPESLSDTRATGGNDSPVTNDALEDILGR